MDSRVLNSSCAKPPRPVRPALDSAKPASRESGCGAVFPIFRGVLPIAVAGGFLRARSPCQAESARQQCPARLGSSLALPAIAANSEYAGCPFAFTGPIERRACLRAGREPLGQARRGFLSPSRRCPKVSRVSGDLRSAIWLGQEAGHSRWNPSTLGQFGLEDFDAGHYTHAFSARPHPGCFQRGCTS
jgi:hypothetical protein